MSQDHKLPLPPAFQEQINLVRSIGHLEPFLALLSRFGIGGDNLKTIIADLKDSKQQATDLAKLIEGFHEAFSELGWLISESTNIETAKAALAVHEDCRVEDAEDILATDYEGERLHFVVTRLCQTKGFKIRREQLQEALTLTQETRYIATAPLLFIIADGVGEDVFQKSIFSEGVNLEELHSLAGQPDALPKLIREMCRTRRKTTRKHISFPYRNGILHGRDFGYGNRLVTAKCWSFLSNIADVIRAREAEEALNPPSNPSLSETLTNYVQTKELRERIEAWTPRPLFEGRINVFAKSEIASFGSGEPEAALVEFLQAWKKNNFGRMGALTVYFDKRAINRRAGEIREMMQDLTLIDAAIIRIKDRAPAVTEITADLTTCVDSAKRTDRFNFIMNCVDDVEEVTIRGEGAAHWQVIPFYQDWAIRQRALLD